jgi:Tfp pilus assembly protein PilV
MRHRLTRRRPCGPPILAFLRRRRPRAVERGIGAHARRGMTLVEAVLAVFVLAVGFAGIVSLLGSVSAAGRKSAFHNIALDVFSAFSAQVQDAYCDFNPADDQVDPGLNAASWVETAQGASSITVVGPIGANFTTTPVTGATSPVTLAYRSIRTQGDCTGAGAVCTRPDIYTVQVHVCDLSDPNRPCTLDTTNGYGTTNGTGYWVRAFELTKTCTIRQDRNGRGEFYSN